MVQSVLEAKHEAQLSAATETCLCNEKFLRNNRIPLQVSPQVVCVVSKGVCFTNQYHLKTIKVVSDCRFN